MKERQKLSHEERTADEPRDEGIYPMRISQVSYVNPDIRLIQMTPNDSPDRRFKVSSAYTPLQLNTDNH